MNCHIGSDESLVILLGEEITIRYTAPSYNLLLFPAAMLYKEHKELYGLFKLSFGHHSHSEIKSRPRVFIYLPIPMQKFVVAVNSFFHIGNTLMMNHCYVGNPLTTQPRYVHSLVTGRISPLCA